MLLIQNDKLRYTLVGECIYAVDIENLTIGLHASYAIEIFHAITYLKYKIIHTINQDLVVDFIHIYDSTYRSLET